MGGGWPWGRRWRICRIYRAAVSLCDDIWHDVIAGSDSHATRLANNWSSPPTPLEPTSPKGMVDITFVLSAYINSIRRKANETHVE